MIIHLIVLFQISLTELNWSLRFKNPKHLLAAHSNKEYPPRFILEICGKEVCEQKSDVTDITFKSLSGLIVYRLNLWAQSEKLWKQIKT